jgi:hypothetical protein
LEGGMISSSKAAIGLALISGCKLGILLLTNERQCNSMLKYRDE